jgi:Ser/Thr protein kinase RdoA (MazF antagonist)
MAASIPTLRATNFPFIAPSSEPVSGDSSNDQINAAAIVEHLRKQGTQYFPSLKPRFSISMERIRGSTNPVFRLVLSDGEKSFGVFAKRPAVYPENNEALSEYKNYTDFNLSRSGPCGFQCPQVLMLISGSEVLLTEEAEGNSLLKLIRGPSAMRHPRSMDCLAAVDLSAKWLAAFHQLAASTEEPGEVTDHIPLLNVARELDAWPAGILGRELAQSLNNWRHSVIGIWRNSACPIGRWHGDFGACNVVVGVDKVTVLDAAFRSPGPQVADLAEFLTYPLLLSCAGIKSSAGYRKIAATFLEGYFGKAELAYVERSLLQDFSLCSLWRSLERHLRAVRRLPKPIRPFAFCYLKIAYGRAFRSVLGSTSLPTISKYSKIACLRRQQRQKHQDLANLNVTPSAH